ncbi:hypothetical protein PAPYR_4817 [Paratrimastix pyriformis]|uniref:Uncharacterized protein n=1 Tax=Paratrimastix pyriformis TaxID=342808 RepID=A0ABQ8UKE5_9EUKA|nr:hypothetical protein PAPYR_4817 [Paratrimastix pyriformis]
MAIERAFFTVDLPTCRHLKDANGSSLCLLFVSDSSFFAHPPQITKFPRAQASPATAGDDSWARLPPELLRAIVEASSSPISAYIQLLSLSSALRASIRGTLRDLSLVVEPNPVHEEYFIAPAITTDALAALVGPCRSLCKLAFTERWRGVDAGAGESEGWVDEAFGGHTQLAVLEQLPPLAESVIERILSHLPGLVELTVNPRFQISTRLLAALARSCPDLQVLRCSLEDSAPQPDFSALAPLSGVLKELDLRGGSPEAEENLAALVSGLSAVTTLRLPHCPPAALEPIASHLTTLGLGYERDIPGPWLCRLEALSLVLSDSAPLAPLLVANQATLRSFTLMLLDTEGLRPLMASLRALPHLNRLILIAFDGRGRTTLSDLLPADLVDRLERLKIDIQQLFEPHPVRITSKRLQQLVLRTSGGVEFCRALDCPALVELEMNCSVTSLRCPRLRILRMPADHQDLEVTAPMPDLEVVDFKGPLVEDPAAWLLTGSSPRLRELSHVRLTRPDLLARLCASESLVRLEHLHLYMIRLPNPLVLKLPGQLEYLDLHIKRRDVSEDDEPPPPLDLQVEAPGLRDFCLATEGYFLRSCRVRLHNCPQLARAWLNTPSLELDAEEVAGTPKAMTMQPRGLFFVCTLDVANLVGLLARHGARLRNMALQCPLRGAGGDWPQLMQALSGLPRLTILDLNVSGASSPLSFACPQLRSLVLEGLPDEVKVVLACPLLELLCGLRDPSRQLVLALPAPMLPPF